MTAAQDDSGEAEPKIEAHPVAAFFDKIPRQGWGNPVGGSGRQRRFPAWTDSPLMNLPL